MSSNTNFVQLKLAAAATAAQTTLTVAVPTAPFQLPAANGTLTLLDVPAAPTKAEIVGYTTVTNNGDGTATLGGVTRGKEGTTAQAWAINAVLVQSLTAADYAADLAAKQDKHANLDALAGLTGSADKLPYFTGSGALSLATLTAAARNLLGATDAAGQRTAIGLGSAATATVTSSPYDNTAGRLLKVGDFGVGGPAIESADFNAITVAGRYFNPLQTSLGLPTGDYWELEHLTSYVPSVFSQRAVGTGIANLGHTYTRSTINGAAGLTPWVRVQQQKEKLVGESYVECLSIVGESTYNSLTLYTNIPAVQGIMWTIKLDGAAAGYTSPVSATIGGYFYAGAVYLPTMTVLADSPSALSNAAAGVVNGKIAIRFEGVGYIPRLNVSVLRKVGDIYSPPEAALQGWSHAFDTAALPSAVTVRTMRAPVLGVNASLRNIPYTGTVGPYEYVALGYVGRELHFGLNQGVGWYLKPDIDGGTHLGTAAYRWATLFAVTGTINTSDARHKTAVQPLSAAELAVAKQLAGEIGTFQWLDAITEKGAAARHHFGVTVQRVMEVFTAHGLDPFRYGVVCYDQWADEVKRHPEEVVPTQVPAVLDADGNVLEAEYIRYEVIPARDEVIREAGDLYSLRMDQLALFLARGQAQRQDDLEARIAALEAAV